MATQFQKMTQGLLQSTTETGICRYGMIKGSLVEKLPICGVLQITRKGKKRKVKIGKGTIRILKITKGNKRKGKVMKAEWRNILTCILFLSPGVCHCGLQPVSLK